MDPLSEIFAKTVLEKVISELPGRLQRLIEDDPEKKVALRKAFQAGLDAALQVITPPDRGRAERYTSTSRRKSFGSFTVLNARASCQQSDCVA